ncbi:MAG: antitoxin VapB family protein [Thermoplasmata archaeon]
MTKTISLSDDAYARLAKLKKEGESFSDVVIKLSEQATKVSPLDAFGSWKGDEKEARKLFRTIIEERSRAMLREVEI